MLYLLALYTMALWLQYLELCSSGTQATLHDAVFSAQAAASYGTYRRVIYDSSPKPMIRSVRELHMYASDPERN
jgi:hypothetical protein